MRRVIVVGALVAPDDCNYPDEIYVHTWDWGVVIGTMWNTPPEGWWTILTNNGKVITEWHENLEVLSEGDSRATATTCPRKDAG